MHVANNLRTKPRIPHPKLTTVSFVEIMKKKYDTISCGTIIFLQPKIFSSIVIENQKLLQILNYIDVCSQLFKKVRKTKSRNNLNLAPNGTSYVAVSQTY
jgi:hypothetical protein